MSTALMLDDVAFVSCDDPKLPSVARAATGKSKRFEAKDDPKHVLVVDDEIGIADSLTEILAGHGYAARAVYSGVDAINFCHELCPDIVVADVVMPKLNGVDTVLAIREFCPKIRILLFSGQAGTSDILARARAMGHDFELLPKPIHPDRLLRTLASSD
jgi:CheY-like chemotaxis protein